MENLSRALEDERPSLQVPWDSLGRMIKPVPGTLIILLGAPGALKSMLSLRWCLGIEAPTRIVSLDTDPRTQAARIVAGLNGITTAQVLEDPHRWAEWLRVQDLRMRLHDWPLGTDDVDEMVTADAEYWGKPPGLVVVDDVSKLMLKTRDYEGFDTAMLELHRIARRHSNVVLALHHVHRGTSSARTSPVKLGDGKFSGEYEAEIMLGAWRPADGRLRISVLKNRFGEDDPSGKLYAELHCDPAIVEIRDHDLYQDMKRPAVAVPSPIYELASEAGIRL